MGSWVERPASRDWDWVGQTPTGGSSGSLAVGESLMQRRRVQDEGLQVVNRFQDEAKGVTVPAEEAPANYVPAAAVIRRASVIQPLGVKRSSWQIC